MVIQNSLYSFLSEKIPFFDASIVDEVLVNYVVSFIVDLSEDDLNETSLDFGDFREMMEAYIPDAQELNDEHIRDWIMATCSEVKATKYPSAARTDPVERLLPLPATKIEKSCKSSYGESSNSAATSDSEDPSDIREPLRVREMEALVEMFPSVSQAELSHCLSLSNGDVENAVQLILYREETGDRLTAKSEPSDRKKTKSESELDPEALKKLIINKYSFVDEEEEKREHRPAPLKAEQKKLIRYLDNKVVSLKGEKFTEVVNPKDNSEEMKKTYVNLKPARKYHFH